MTQVLIQLELELKLLFVILNSSTEKIAEFNTLAKDLANFKGKDLAYKLGEFRNARIDLANRLYNISNSIYHIVARRDHKLIFFETDYNKIDINNINSVKDNKASLQFEDGNNWYSFNYSKSTLFRTFCLPQNPFELSIEILENPYTLLLELLENKTFNLTQNAFLPGIEYVILPLYGIKNKEKFVFPKSGLNQWNAGGRKRDLGEIYIPIPVEIHKNYPKFFPAKDVIFELKIPTGEVFSAKVCQDNSKALMTNPNKALADWLLRKVFQVKEGELLTIEKMNELGFDSVIIRKNHNNQFSIDKAKSNSYQRFYERKPSP